MDYRSRARIPNSDNELEKLRAENNQLHDELSVMAADKEFVWSLWKKLQVNRPNITEAITAAIKREHEKSEFKEQQHQKVLRAKDEAMTRLENQVQEYAADLFQLRSSNTHSDERARCLEREKKDVQVQLDQARKKISELESKSQEYASRQAVRELDQANMDLKQKVSRLERELEDAKREKDDAKVMRDSYRDRIKHLENDIKDMGVKYDGLIKENNDLKKKTRKSEPHMTAMKREIDAKNKEMEALRKELADVWESHAESQEHTAQQASLIRQLKALQADTQAMLKNQEDAFSIETQSMQEKLAMQERVIGDLQHKVGSRGQSSGGHHHRSYVDREMQASDEQDSDMDSQIEELRSEVKHLRSRIDDRPTTRDRSVSPIGSPYTSRGRSTHRSKSMLTQPRSRSQPVLPEPRSKSRGRSRSQEVLSCQSDDAVILGKKLEATQRALEVTQSKLHFKTVELEETRCAHRRRIERVKALQTSYKLLKEQHKILEEEAYGKRNKKKRIPRPPPKALQKEDSDAVWNELAYHKKEHRNLVVERMNLEEEFDKLRVQVSQDAATIHQLKLSLEQEQQEVAALSREVAETQHCAGTGGTEEQLEATQGQLEKAVRKLMAEHKHRQAAEEERDKAMEERREARSEANSLRKQEAEVRMLLADVKRDAAQKDLARRKKKQAAAHHRKTQLAKKYQKSLNNSIRQMSGVFGGEFDQEQVWEDVSETLEDEESSVSEDEEEDTTEQTVEESENTASSLGEAIMQRARQEHSPHRGLTTSHPTHRTVESMSEHVKRMMQKKNEAPTHDYEAAESKQPGGHRDIALSPIHFQPRQPSRHKAQCGRQLHALKQRINALTRQVTILKIAKEHASKAAVENKKTAKQLDNEVNTIQQKLDTARHTIQRLSNDLDRVRDEKEELEQQVTGTGSDLSLHAQQDWIALNNRLRSTASELSKQTGQVKQLKTENALQAEKIQQLNDRLSHQERDLTQKRTLVEDLRIKNRLLQENASSEQDAQEEVSSKLKTSQETAQRLKTQLESQRVRLQAVTKDKQNTEHTLSTVTDELERKCKQVLEVQRKCADLQCSVTALERTGQQQLHALAQHSETAIDTAQAKLTQAATRIHEFNKFIKMLAHSLVSSLGEQRAFMQQRQRLQQQQQEVVEPSLQRAQHMACDILNITESDLHDLMSNSGDVSHCSSEDIGPEVKHDRKWTRRWEKALQSRQDFAMALVDLFMEKVNEKCQLASSLATIK